MTFCFSKPDYVCLELVVGKHLLVDADGCDPFEQMPTYTCRGFGFQVNKKKQKKTKPK